jgi:hypothetical protein
MCIIENMTQSITIYTKKDIEEIVFQSMLKHIEIYSKAVDKMQIRLLDLENMIKRGEKER